MGHSVSEIVRQLGFPRSAESTVYLEYMDGGQKTSDRANCKTQSVLIVRGERFRESTRVPFLNARQRLASLAWAKEHSDRSVENWKQVDVLEQSVKSHHTAPTNLTEVGTALANILKVIPLDRFQKHVESMPRRVAAIIKARGNPARY
ncbi:hypothetical protein TNCV_1814771 [Trichonephila clavipes]|nr:hypothetical protein TNCV_1814771 [Trichonephila clavipes]